MPKLNENYLNLKASYLFSEIAHRTAAYKEANPEKGAQIIRLGIGDVTLPLGKVVIAALHEGVDAMATSETFKGYGPEQGYEATRNAIADYYKKRKVSLLPEEVFVSSGASDELGDILDLFGRDKTVMIMEPAYPAYVDANIIAGNRIIHIPSGKENGFLPLPDETTAADVIYICSPNNPTGAVFNCEQLKLWVDYANRIDAVLLFDAAYEAFIEEEDIPHSIFEIEGAKTCAIEICSLSKTAGFTGTRLGYTVIPKELNRSGMNLNEMWVRNRTTKTNGVSYIIQRGGAAVFTEEGQRQIQERIQVYKNNAKVLMESLDQLGIWYCGGKNAPYIWMKCPDGMGSWEFFDYLLQEIQVVGTPGEGFGACGEGYFRFSTFGSPEDTKEAARRLAELLSKNVKEPAGLQ